LGVHHIGQAFLLYDNSARHLKTVSASQRYGGCPITGADYTCLESQDGADPIARYSRLTYHGVFSNLYQLFSTMECNV
jgi:hypothetical protein